jgi:hypothetical protein
MNSGREARWNSAYVRLLTRPSTMVRRPHQMDIHYGARLKGGKVEDRNPAGEVLPCTFLALGFVHQRR